MDEALRNELDKHLSILKRSGFIREWHDHQIGAGREWAKEINEHLKTADIILLLVSPDFISSDFCFDVEMRQALQRHERHEAVVIPVILRPVDFEQAPFAKLQALPTGALPVTDARWNGLDFAFRDVAVGIRKVVDQIKSHRLQELVRLKASAWVLQQRALDACIPSEIPLGEAREVLVQIRLEESDGLRMVLERDQVRRDATRSFSANVQDVHTAPFHIALQINAEGATPTQKLELRLAAPNFKPEMLTKRITVPALEDSQTYSFLVSSQHEGEHLVNVELICDDATIVEQLLRTRAVEHGGPGGTPGMTGTIILASLPLRVNCVAKAREAHA